MNCGGVEKRVVEKEKQWKCGKAGSINLQRVGSIVRDIGDPCLYQSSMQANKMLKPDKWQAIFDNDGKVFGFQKALRLIGLGGIDPSIRAEVWEFLLGCYSLGSTAVYRKHLRVARRERYEDLIKQCQTMHSSIGTGTLAYPVGSKVMDMRTLSKDEGERETIVKSRQSSIDGIDKLEISSDLSNGFTDMSHRSRREILSCPTDLVTVRTSSDGAEQDTSCSLSTSGLYSCKSLKAGREYPGQLFVNETCFDFPPLPVTNLFESEEENDYVPYDEECSTSNDISYPFNSEIELAIPDGLQPISEHHDLGYKTEIVNRLRMSDVQERPLEIASTSKEGATNHDRVSEWLWTLHRIVVDVVRTDSHLEFYKDTKNLARMSDILAVYAWVDPATGYCQGMSDLLSPFVVLFEDDADAFWCFEMLIRRMRDNFLTEGPTGVMKQLQALWHILELTDREMFSHLSNIGAESLHFAFPMLLVLFRRELSFNDALRMWEMMWAADFDGYLAYNLEENRPEALIIDLPRDFGSEIQEESLENGNGSVKGTAQSSQGNKERSISEDDGIQSASTNHFCGLTRNFWSKGERVQICNIVSSTGNGDDLLPVFCVAAILILNRNKLIRETHSIDDMIKIFNDKLLKIHVKRCIRTAIKIRKKYFNKLIKRQSSGAQSSE